MLMEESVKEFAAELRVLSRLHHVNIVPFFGMYKAPAGDAQSRYLLVTKFAVRVATHDTNTCGSTYCRRGLAVAAVAAIIWCSTLGLGDISVVMRCQPFALPTPLLIFRPLPRAGRRAFGPCHPVGSVWFCDAKAVGAKRGIRPGLPTRQRCCAS